MVIRRLSMGLLVALVASSGGCGLLGLEPFVDFSTFEPLPALTDLDAVAAEPAAGVAYWELRNAWSPGDSRVLLSGGRVSRDDLAPDVLGALDSTRVFGGFAPSCLPGGCYHYFVTADTTGSVATWETAASVANLFAPVGSLTEAALIVHAQGFDWSLSIETGAARRVQDAWQFVVTKLVRGCDPVQVDRFHLEVDVRGAVTELKREVYSREYGVCI